MILTTTAILTVALALPMSNAVNVQGYLENDCNGEQVFGFGSIKTGQCYSVAEYRASGSIAATGFGNHLRLNFFFDDNCKDQVAHTDSDECYIHTQTGVKSFRLKKT